MLINNSIIYHANNNSKNTNSNCLLNIIMWDGKCFTSSYLILITILPGRCSNCILQMRKLRLREFRCFAQGHTRLKRDEFKILRHNRLTPELVLSLSLHINCLRGISQPSWALKRDPAGEAHVSRPRRREGAALQCNSLAE